MMKFNDMLTRIRTALAGRYEPEGVRSLAAMYWRGLLVAAGILVIASVLYGVWDIFSVLDALASAPDTSPPPPAAVDRVALHSVVQGFQTRQTQFDDFRASPPPTIPDPSK